MGITLEEPRELLPVVRLPAVGDFVTGHLIHIKKGIDKDQQTGKPKLKANGEAKQVQILTVLITDFSDGAEVGLGDSYDTPQAGVLARIYVQGGTWNWWIEAKKQVECVEVGDVLRWKFESVTPNPNRQQSDFKNRKFSLRKPKPSEADLVSQCEARHKQIIDQVDEIENVTLSTDDDF